MNHSDLRLETGRLVLRPPRIEDFEGYAELLADEEAARFIGGSAPRGGAWRRFLQQPGAWFVQGFGMFSVLDRVTGEWLGQTGPWRPECWPGNEIGWAFRRSAWGKGYATESTRVAIDWALENLGWEDFVHCIVPENHASQRLAQRMGSSVLRREWMPPPYEAHLVDVWGQSRAEWMARRG